MRNTGKAYESQDITVVYDAQRCIHAAECVRGLPQVFDPASRPWIKPAVASADAIAEVVMRCPTGALQFVRKDGGAAEPVPAETTVAVSPHGPLYVRGNIEVLAPDGSVILKDTRVALCRCGASSNKPFCDNSHRLSGFQDAAVERAP